MPKNSIIWTPQELKLLEQLKESQIRENKNDWVEITRKINQVSLFKKNAKQCREKYINKVKTSQCPQQVKEWQQEELVALEKLYNENGPTWSQFQASIPNKLQNQIKNRFYCGLKKLSNQLQYHSNKYHKSQRYQISSFIVSSLLDFLNKLLRTIKDLHLTMNPNSEFFRLRNLIIRNCCFNQRFISVEQQEQENEEKLNAKILYFTNFLYSLKSINNKIRCFGVYKVKNKKKWSFNVKSLRTICSYDKIFLQDEQTVFNRLNIPREEESSLSAQLLGSEKQESRTSQQLELVLIDLLPMSVVQNHIIPDRRNQNQALDEEIYEILGESYQPTKLSIFYLS